ncbi:MAG: sigma-70 family RNA polymerase sigma factor [Euzebyaceae bacterium]|nr:sigma-70 family RNA polymerase sigma factor [Euzebyaceae bacterium]
MPRTREQLEQAAADARTWLDALDPAADPAEDPRDLRRIGLALGDVATAEGELADAVAAARANDRSWGEIALALGVSKQAARERYGQASKVN